jgi:hypothetical protein
MRRRFVIAVEGLDAKQESRFRDYINKESFGWWHWINNVWLLTTNDEAVSTEEIRRHIQSLNSNARCLVFEFPEDITWSATATVNAKGKSMTEWLLTTWGKTD